MRDSSTALSRRLLENTRQGPLVSSGGTFETRFHIEEGHVVINRFAGVTLALAIAVFGIPGLLQAQGLTGQISGTVTDTSGGVLPGVTVTIKNAGKSNFAVIAHSPEGD